MARVLLAGATGSLGLKVLHELAARGHWVRTLSRGSRTSAMVFDGEHVQADLTRPESLIGACRGVDLVVSCAGSSMRLNDFRDRRRYLDVDFAGNRNLLDEAEREGTPRFVYVSLHEGEKLRHNPYADAHEQFVDALSASPVSSLVIRPSGFFSFLLEILRMARKGRGVVIGDGSARANPVHEADLADFSVDHLESEREQLSIGGPEVLSRRGIVKLALRVAGRPERVRSVPEWAARAAATAGRPLNPRLAALLAFGVDVSVKDVVAPAYGFRHLGDFFGEVAGSKAGPATRQV